MEEDEKIIERARDETEPTGTVNTTILRAIELERNDIVSFLMDKGHFQSFGKKDRQRRYLLLPKESFDELLEKSGKKEES